MAVERQSYHSILVVILGTYGGWGLDALKMCRIGQSMFLLHLKCHILSFKTTRFFHIIKDERLVSKMEG